MVYLIHLIHVDQGIQWQLTNEGKREGLGRMEKGLRVVAEAHIVSGGDVTAMGMEMESGKGTRNLQITVACVLQGAATDHGR